MARAHFRLVLCVCCTLVQAWLAEASQQFFSIKYAHERKAVCNDDSPAGFYLSRAAGNSTKWLIYLQGGGLCTDKTSCLSRSLQLVSSKDWPATVAMEGLLSQDRSSNPGFFDFNMVFVPYCTSDLWFGNGGTSLNSFNFRFYGAHVVPAVVEDLAHFIPSPTLASATEVLFAGGSAGGFGVLLNLPQFASLLTWAPIKAIVDAGWFVDAPAYNGEVSVLDLIKPAVHMFNATLDPQCLAAFPDNTTACFLGFGVYPFLPAHVPVILQSSHMDGWIVSHFHIKPPLSREDKAYLANLEQMVLQSFKEYNVTSVFSAGCVIHTAVRSASIYSTLTVENTSLRQALSSWYTGGRHVFMDSCTGINCNPEHTCPYAV